MLHTTILDPWLSVWTVLILPLCISPYDFKKYDYGMLTSDALYSQTKNDWGSNNRIDIAQVR